MEIGISLGSNLGDRLAALRAGVQRIGALAGVRVTALSPVYETDPVDVPARYRSLPFLNAVVVVTAPPPLEPLAQALRDIEAELGRVRGRERNAPRPIDLDIIYADWRRVHTRALRVPHPRWAERRFVVQPLADVRPELVLPGRSRSVRKVLAALPPAPRARLFAKKWMTVQ